MSDSDIQIDAGDFTRLHNTILEKLAVARFTASEYRCLMFLFRATYGWQKKEDAISLSQWAAGVGLDAKKDRGNVLNTLNSLVAKRVICMKVNGAGHVSTWGFNKHFDDWDKELFPQSVISAHNTTVIQEDNTLEESVIQPHNTSVISAYNKSVIQPHNHKRKKEILKKRESAAKPPPHPAVIIFREVWEKFPTKPQMRTIAKRVTDNELWREACQAWADKGYNPTNLTGMLDFYDHPERFRTEYRPPPRGGDYRTTNNGVNAVMDYVQRKGLLHE